MADPRYYVEEINQSAEDEERGHFPKVASSEEDDFDIHQTGHFTHLHLGNISEFQNNLKTGGQNVVNNNQTHNANNIQNRTQRNENNAHGKSIQNLAYNYRSSGQQRVNTAEGRRQNQNNLIFKQVQAQKLGNINQQKQTVTNQRNQQLSPQDSLQYQPSGQRQASDGNKIHELANQSGKPSQNEQNNQQKEAIIQQENESVVKNLINQYNQLSQNNQNLQARQVQNKNQSQNQRSQQSIQSYQQERSNLQRDISPPVQQVASSTVVNTNQPINQQVQNRIHQQIQSLPPNNIANMTPIRPNSPPNNPNRYFPVSSSQNQALTTSNTALIRRNSQSTLQSKPQTPINQNMIINQTFSRPSQAIQQRHVEEIQQNSSIIDQTPVSYINVNNPPTPQKPSAPIIIQQSPVQKPVQFNHRSSGHLPLNVRQSMNSPVNIAQRPSFFHSQIINQPQSQILISRSQSPPLLQNRQSKASVSYSSNNSKRRPSVRFTYLSNIQPAKPIAIPIHTHTVVQKIVTVVWQYRYWTVIEKFNFITQRFNQLTNQLRIITQLLQTAKNQQKFEEIYHDLLMKHTILLEILSETQHDMVTFEEQNNEFKQEIEHESELKQQILYKDRCRALEEENAKLIREIERLNQLINTQGNIKVISQLEMRIKEMEQETFKSQTFNNQLTKYITKLQNDNNLLNQQLQKLRSGEVNINQQHIKLIKNQDLIIRELEQEVKKKQQQYQENMQQYGVLINQLQGRVQELEKNDQTANSQQNEQKYTEIIETQRNIIENIEAHFREFTQTTIGKEEELKGILKNQQAIIHGLEEQLKKANLGHSGDQGLLREIQANKLLIKELQMELQKESNITNGLRQQIFNKNQQIHILNQERLTMQAKFEQKLASIEQQIKIKTTESYLQRNQPTYHGNHNRQIQELNQEVNRLSAELKKRQQEKRKMEEEFIIQEETLRRKLMEKESENRLLNDKFSMTEEQTKRKIQEKEKKIKSLEEQIQNLNYKLKSNTIKTPRNIEQAFDILTPSKNDLESRSMRQKLSQKDQQLNEVIRQKEAVEKKFQNLQNNYNTLDQQNSRRSQQLMSLKRQITSVSNYQTEIKTLTQSLNKKNQEILELKTMSFERNQLKVQLQAIKNERNILKNTIQNKNQQVQKIRQTVNELESKLRQTKLKQSLFPNTNQSVADQLQLMYESVKKKQSQLTKLKQTNQLLETNVQQLQYQLERTKNKLNSTEKNLNHEKQQFADRINEYQAKIKQFESKIKNSDELHKQFKAGFEKQIQTLDTIIKQKQDTIRKLQGENKVLKNKLKNHDSKVQQVDLEREALNNKIKELETMRQDMKKKINTLEESTQNNNKQLYDNYQIKIVELEAALKVKDNKIRQLENNIQTIKIKTNHSQPTGEDFINQQQIEVLRKKIAEYQSRIYNQNNIRNNFNNYKPRDYQSGYIFEQRVIYELKSENERLRSLLSGKGIQYSEDSPSKIGNVAFLQKRLLDFNQKLEEMIEENKNLEERNGNFAALLTQKNNNQELLQSFERQRVAIYRKYRGEIAALQARMVDLQRYCSSLQNFQSNSVYNATSQTKTVVNDNIKGVYSQQLTYYRQKNKQLEDRIDSHIKLNKQLKQKLQGLLKTNGVESNSIQFYKNQSSQYEKQIAQYLARIKELTEQNNTLTQNLNDSRKYHESESKIIELENKIHELNRKISQLQMQNGILEADLTKYTQEAKTAADQAIRYRTGGQQREQKLINLQNSLRQANSKVYSYEMQITKLTNQIKLLQSEIERLNENAQYRYGEESTEVSRLKTKVAQLQSEIRQYQQQSTTWSEAKIQYEQTITKLNNRINNLEADISRLNIVYQNLNKKARETENEFYELENKLKLERSRAAQLQASLRRRQDDADGMNQFLEGIRKQRDSEGVQSKQRLEYITQLQQTIKSLRFELSQSKSQLERLKIEYSQIQSQSGNRTALLEGLAYKLEFLRSSFIEIQVLIEEIGLGQINSRQNQIIQEVRQTVSNGLSICSETFALL